MTTNLVPLQSTGTPKLGLAEMTTIRNHLKSFATYCDTGLIMSELVENAGDAGATEVHIATTKDTLSCFDNGEGFAGDIRNSLSFSYSDREHQAKKTGVKGTGLKSSIGSICQGQLYVFSRSQAHTSCACIDYSRVYNAPPNTPVSQITDVFWEVSPDDPMYKSLEVDLEAFLTDSESETGTLCRATGCTWGTYETSKQFARPINRSGRGSFRYLMRHRLSALNVYFDNQLLKPLGAGFGDAKCPYDNFIHIFDRDKPTISLNLSVPEDVIPGGILKAEVKFSSCKEYGGGAYFQHSGLNLIRLGRQVNREKPFRDTKYWLNRFPAGAGFVIADLHVDANIDKILTLEEDKKIVSLKSFVQGYDFEAELKDKLGPFKSLLAAHFDSLSETQGASFSNEAEMVRAKAQNMRETLISTNIYTAEEAQHNIITEYTLDTKERIDMVCKKPNGDWVLYEIKKKRSDYKAGVRQLIGYAADLLREKDIVCEVVLAGGQKDDTIDKYIKDTFSTIAFQKGDDFITLEAKFEHWK